MARFTSHLYLEKDRDGKVLVTEPLIFMVSPEQIIVVPVGFYPKFAASLRMSPSAVLLNYLYSRLSYPREEAESVYFKALQAESCPHWCAVFISWVLRYSGEYIRTAFFGGDCAHRTRG
jgi:hypothetical protein